jgi:hypothetical protein
MKCVSLAIYVRPAAVVQLTTATETSARSSPSTCFQHTLAVAIAFSSAQRMPSMTAENLRPTVFLSTSVPQSTFFVHGWKSPFSSRTRGLVQHDV